MNTDSKGNCRDIYTENCYFSPTYSQLASVRGLPYLPIYKNIRIFASMLDIILWEEFNAPTKDQQNNFIWHKREHEWRSHNRRRWSEVMRSRYHFLTLVGAHNFMICSGLSQWPRSHALTCWNPEEGEFRINLMRSPSILSEITNFMISSRPICLATNHAYLHVKVKDGCQKVVTSKNRIGQAKYRIYSGNN